MKAIKNKNLLISYSLSFVVFFLYSYVFFNRIYLAAIISLILSLKFKSIFENFFDKRLLYKKRAMLRDFLDILNSSITSGKNFFESIKDSRDEIKSYYGEEDLIYKELNSLILNLENGHSMDQALEVFSQGLEFEEADIFVDSLLVGLGAGMDIRALVENCKLAINEQILIENEIANKIDNSARELIIMIILPIVILFLLQKTQFTHMGFVDYLIRSIAFIMILFSIYLGEKIVSLDL